MTARPLLLIGSGGLGREVLAAVRAIGGAWQPVGFLDDNPARTGIEVDGLTVLGPSSMVHDLPEPAIVACIASDARPAGRLTLARGLGVAGDRWATIVHPAASVAVGVELGAGTVLLAGAVITAPQRIGEHVVAMPHTLITHDDEIGDGVTMAGGAAVAGAVQVGQCAYLGSASSVRQGLKIGARAVIGMGAVVLRDVPQGETWAGVPARRLRHEEER